MIEIVGSVVDTLQNHHTFSPQLMFPSLLHKLYVLESLSLGLGLASAGTSV